MHIVRSSGDLMTKAGILRRIMRNMTFFFHIRENLEDFWKGIELGQKILSRY